MDTFMQTLVSTLLGVIVGSVIACWITYKFQKKLLRQQLDAQTKAHQELLKAIEDTGAVARAEISAAIGTASLMSRIS